MSEPADTNGHLTRHLGLRLTEGDADVLDDLGALTGLGQGDLARRLLRLGAACAYHSGAALLSEAAVRAPWVRRADGSLTPSPPPQADATPAPTPTFHFDQETTT